MQVSYLGVLKKKLDIVIFNIKFIYYIKHIKRSKKNKIKKHFGL